MFLLLNQTPFIISKVQLSKHGMGRWDTAEYKANQVSYEAGDWHMFDLKIIYTDKGKTRYEIFDKEAFDLPNIKKITLTPLQGDKWQAHYE